MIAFIGGSVVGGGTPLQVLRKTLICHGISSGRVLEHYGIVRAVGSASSAVPGPTNTTLVAYLTLSADAWQRLSVSGEKPTKLLTEDARALLPPRLLEGNQSGSDFVELSCRTVNADLAKSWYVQLHAVRCGDGLLSVFRSK